MSYRLHTPTIVLAALVFLASGPVFAQSQTKSTSSSPAKKWTPPKTSSGDPDLQGTWTSTTTTPFERPAQFGNRLFLTDEEFAESEKRLARLLLLLANFGKDQKPEPVIAKISQEMLAEMIGTTRARVSFFMNKFRKLGFIKYNGGIEVHTSLLNAILHDLPQSDSSHARRPQDE